MNFDNLINRIYFVGIDLTASEDEQQIFDTINSLGVSLTTAELLKNELFKRDEENVFNKTWKKTFEGDDKSYWSTQITTGRHRRENIDLLLQSYLMIQSEAHNDYIGTEAIFQKYKDFMEEKRKENLGFSKTGFIDGLIKTAGIYKFVINPDLTSQVIDKNVAIERINTIIFGLNTTTIIPYLVFIFSEVKDENERNRMLALIENYLIRRTICKDTTKNYNNLFASFIRGKVKTYSSLLEKLDGENQTDKFPSDLKFRKAIQENSFTNQQAKVFLYLLEVSIRDVRRDSTTVLGLDEYSLEHIMPKKWREYWTENFSADQERERDELILRLGNLTIITSSLNSSIKNADWQTKKSGKGNNLGIEEHSRGIKIFDRPEFLQSPTWNEDTILKRSEFICEQALQVWVCPPEIVVGKMVA